MRSGSTDFTGFKPGSSSFFTTAWVGAGNGWEAASSRRCLEVWAWWTLWRLRPLAWPLWPFWCPVVWWRFPLPFFPLAGAAELRLKTMTRLRSRIWKIKCFILGICVRNYAHIDISTGIEWNFAFYIGSLIFFFFSF
jgi:hypothetical protein